MAEEFGFSVAINTPYKGGFITQKYARTPTGLYVDQTFGQRNAESLQIEYNRKSFGLNEETLALEDINKFRHAQEFTNRCLKLLAQRARQLEQRRP